MKKNYFLKNSLFVLFVCAAAMVASCKKDKQPTKSTDTTTTVKTPTPTKIGLTEVTGVDSSTNTTVRDLYIQVNKIGTQTISTNNSYVFFDTGSGGLVFDAHDIIPSSMITTSGIVFTGDSTFVNGITITNKTYAIDYGDDASETLTVYGNLAYAPVTIDQGNGNLVIKRLPFLLTYLAKDNNGVVYDAHTFDIFGSNPEYDYVFDNGVALQSPFAFYTPGTGLSSGFKIGALGTSNFSYNGTYVNNAIYLGLTDSDLSGSSGFNFTDMAFSSRYGYDPYIQGTVTYNGKTVSTDILFDTGTNAFSIIEDPTAAQNNTLLAVNSQVGIKTNSGFNFSYSTAATTYNTYVEKESAQNQYPTIFGIDLFLQNSYIVDNANHRIGMKNN